MAPYSLCKVVNFRCQIDLLANELVAPTNESYWRQRYIESRSQLQSWMKHLIQYNHVGVFTIGELGDDPKKKRK